jgi:HSP90 family molecular chaperone
VLVDGERANSADALWTKQPSQCKPEDYEAFFKLLSHTGADRPL